MSDVSQPTVTDEAGIPRTADGTMADPNQTTKPEIPPSNEKTEEPKVEVKPEVKPENKSLLNPDGTKKEEPVKAATGAPEKYEPFKVKEGFTLSEPVAAEAGTLFKDMNLTQEQGQRLVDFYQAKTEELARAPVKAYQDLRASWVKEAKALPGIGNELEPGGKVASLIGKAIDQIGNPQLAKDFRAALDLTGFGDHPAAIQVLHQWAQQVTEGTSVRGRGPSPLGQQAPGTGRKSAAQEMYPTLPSGTGT